VCIVEIYLLSRKSKLRNLLSLYFGNLYSRLNNGLNLPKRAYNLKTFTRNEGKKKPFFLSQRNLDKDYRNSICQKNMHKISLLWFSSCMYNARLPCITFFFYITRKTFYWLQLWSLSLSIGLHLFCVRSFYFLFVFVSQTEAAILFHLCRSYLPIVSFYSDILSSFVLLEPKDSAHLSRMFFRCNDSLTPFDSDYFNWTKLWFLTLVQRLKL
jgi:hypothetical protein